MKLRSASRSLTYRTVVCFGTVIVFETVHEFLRFRIRMEALTSEMDGTERVHAQLESHMFVRSRVKWRL